MITLIGKKPTGIIFDLDGTLWDASETCAKAWNETFKQAGYDKKVSKQDVHSFAGLKLETIFTKFLSFIPPNEYSGIIDLYEQNENCLMRTYGGRLYPDVKNILHELSASFRLFIVSNCLNGYIENFIQFNGLENLFSDFESSGNTGLTKSENIGLIIERNRLQNAVYVGDTQLDYEAAAYNNIPFIYASYGFGEVDGYTHRIEQFSSMLQLLQLCPSFQCWQNR